MANESRLLISIDARNAERTARELSRELQNITNGGNQADRQVNQLGSSLRSLAGYMAGIVTVGSAINRIDAYTGLQNRLKLVTGSQVELNTAMTDTFTIAQRTASSWDSVAMVYQRFADNADRLNISMQQTASLTETVSKAISVSGGSAASAEAALMQFGQALASGVLRGEEFNSIAEQAPGLLKAIAFGLDTNVGSLRAMAAEGKITGDVLVESLGKAKPYIDDLFNKTDFTIAQEFTRLSNEVTKFVGEAGKGTGAASALGGAIGFLSQNLSTIADIAVVGGVALLTKTILAQTVAIYGSITASVARRAADLAALESQVQLAGLEVQRTRQVLALAASEVNLARTEYNSAATRTARAAATMRLTQAEIALALAEKQKTAATIADTAAQNANNAARSRGAMLLGLVGGPIGAITIGVAALAAGYMYLKNQTAEANAKLEEQGKVALETDESLKKLSGNDKISAVNNLTVAFDDQNKKLAESKKSMDAVLFAIRASSVENEKARKITEDARRGIISYDEAIKLLNKEKIPADLYEELKKQSIQYDENSAKASRSKDVLKIFGIEVKLTGNAAQDAAIKIRDKANATDQDAEASRNAAKANREYTSSLGKKLWDQQYLNAVMITHNKTQEEANLLLEARRENEKVGIKGVTAEQKKLIAGIVAEGKTLEARNKAISNGNKSQKDGAKEADRERKQALKDSENLDKQQGEQRVSIAYSYLDDLAKMEEDFQREIQSIRDANFGSEQKKFEDQAKARYDFNHEMYLAQITEEINLFQWSDNQKLDHWKRTQLEIIESSGKYNDEIKQLKIKALNDEYALEKAYLELARQQREFQAREQFMSETDRINERYRLEEGEILKINDAKERAFMLEMNRLKKQEEERVRIQDAQKDWGGVQSTLGGTTEMDQTFSTQFDQTAKSQELFDSQLALAETAAERERIWQEHENRMIQIEQSGANARRNLTLDYAQGMIGGYAEMFKSIQGEQSTAYRAMFAVQKAFAIAQVLMNAPESYSKAYNAMVGIPLVGPFIAPAAGVAAVALQLAQAAQIKSVKAGFQSGGYTGGGGVSEVAGVVHGQEYVLNANATKRVGKDTLDAINSGGDLKSTSPVNIIINPPSGYEAITKKDGDNVTIDIVEKMIDRSWDAVSNPNSNQSRAMQSAFALQPNRNN